MSAIEEKVVNAVEGLKGEMTSFLQSIVKQPSTLGNERGAQEIVYRKLKSLGLPADLWDLRMSEVNTHPAFAPVEWDYSDRPNVTSVLQGAGGGRSLALDGHIDVVSPEPLWGWSRDPWGAEIVGNQMFGRGTMDMKGGLAMMVLALEAVINSNVKLKGNVYFESVIEEECGGNGALACRLKGHAGDAGAAIIAEPSGLLLVNGELGVMWFRVRIKGKSGHPTQTQKIPNVIESCYPLMQALHRMEDDMNNHLSHPLFVSHKNPIVLNIGEIKGGHWPSSTPAECSFNCRLSYEPGVSNTEMRKKIETWLFEASHGNPLYQQDPPQVEYYGFQSEGDSINPDQEFIKILGTVHKKVTGTEIIRFAGDGTSDLHSFNLYSHTPAVIYGPNGGNAHGVDEYVDLDSIVTGAKSLSLFILEWCGIAEGEGLSV